MIETYPFDPAEYLDSEEGIEAYFADARLDGAAALTDAVEVVARARTLMQQRESGQRSQTPRQHAR